MSAWPRIRAWIARTGLSSAALFWRPQPAQAVRRILVVEMTRLGDLVAASALLEPLRRAFPGAELEMAGSAAYAPLLEGAVRFHPLSSGGWAFLRDAWRLRARLSDPSLLLVSASPAARNSVVALLSRPGRACGYLFPEAGKPWDYDAPAPVQALGGAWQATGRMQKGWHLVQRAGLCLSVAGIAAEGLRPRLSAQGARQARRVVLHAGANWERRRWPLDRFVELAGALAAEGAECILIPAEAGDPGPVPAGVRVAEAMGLEALRELLGSASLFIGNDSGPLHLAAALGTPCLALFGPNVIEHSGPWPLPGPGSPHRALWEEVPCRPCGQLVCIQPWDWCLGKVSTSRVLAEAKSILERDPS